ncbi:hypothetical protein [Pseudovibrio sp. POLY-S9]|uniref:hypothetical protein n=1 Tax=Pseudovibrio sp. POLY-S9 TaxID=1576596 RepID=UPI000AEBDB42|nr:hypothetical protein [Pseudovibrio sp. POLY-S9]
MPFSMTPNYEMSLFIAQVTGSVIVTDSDYRWSEFQSAQHRERGVSVHPWKDIYGHLNVIPLDLEASLSFQRSPHPTFVKVRGILKSADSLIANDIRDPKKISEMAGQANEVVAHLREMDNDSIAEIKFLSPEGGFYDTNVQRMLLKSNAQQYRDKVNSACFVRFRP